MRNAVIVCGQHLEQFLADVARLQTGEPQPGQGFDAGQGLDQFCQRVATVVG